MINNEFTRQWLKHIAEELHAPMDFGNALPVQAVQVYVTGVTLPVDTSIVTKR